MIGNTLFSFLLASTVGAETIFLRGSDNISGSNMSLFRWDISDEADSSLLHRGLQETVVVIPIIPIIIIICLICCLCNKNNEAQQRPTEVKPSATGNRIVEVVDLKPRLVTAAATKFSPYDQPGVHFATDKDYAEITRIGTDSMFKDTALASGMKVVSINNIIISSGEHASQVIASCKSVVTVLAHTQGYFGNTSNFVTATACKTQPDQKMGVVFKKEANSTQIVLKTISETSLLVHDREMLNGIEVVTINNVNVQSVTHAQHLAVNAFPLVTILARRNMAVAAVAEPSLDSNENGEVGETTI